MTIQSTIKTIWGFDSFRPLQQEAVETILSGQDSIVILPTGGGKSLCFQAPVMTMDGTAVVISPLISLMKDQVDALNQVGIAAVRIDSSMEASEKRDVYKQLKSGTVKLVYISPERLVMPDFMAFLKTIPIAYFVIDEAHCVSMWGHDFRPEYRKLRILKQAFPDKSVHAFTATATEQVRGDIAVQLDLKNAQTLIGSFDRPNLIFRSEQRVDLFKQVDDIVRCHKNESGIIYCLRRADTEDLAARLLAMGYRALPYHAGMRDEKRKKHQDAFIRENVDIIVATIAFGMGIDKSNVRYVIHAAMPKSLEHYQQESGRAGRDGLEADCTLLYSGGDFHIWKHLMQDMPPDTRRVTLGKLSDMYRYCTGVTCRHKQILAYFGEAYEKENCGACDICNDEKENLEDALVTGQKILSCVVRLNEEFGADYTAGVLTGSENQRILGNRHHQLSTHGLLSDFRKTIVRNWIEQLFAQGYLHKTEEYSVLKVTEKGWKVLKGNETPRLSRPSGKQTRKTKVDMDSWEGVSEELFAHLKSLRKQLADAQNKPAYLVFSDKSLRDMARLKPRNRDEFLEVNGVGDYKADQYAPLFLKAIAEWKK